MTESWWPKPPDNFKHKAVYCEIVEMAMEAVAQRMAEREAWIQEPWIDGPRNESLLAEQLNRNRRWLGLERKEG